MKVINKGLLYVPFKTKYVFFQYKKNILLYVFLNKVQISFEFESIALLYVPLEQDTFLFFMKVINKKLLYVPFKTKYVFFQYKKYIAVCIFKQGTFFI